MKFYAYKGDYPFGKEPLGCDGRLIFELKTIRGALKRCYQYLGSPFKLFSFTNIYNDATFIEIKER
jgi:hypothetical protein